MGIPQHLAIAIFQRLKIQINGIDLQALNPPKEKVISK